MLFGAFSEQSFPLDPTAIVTAPDTPTAANTREWLARTHAALKHLLPPKSRPALLTEELVDANHRPIDVFAHFDLKPDRLGSLRTNWDGLAHTAQAAGAGREGHEQADDWPDFQAAWLPGFEGLPLAARLGWATSNGKIRDADAIVILPGLLGDNRILRTRDLAIGLRTMGFHVVAVELRGNGSTDQRTPDQGYSFSSLETVDLLCVSRWLQSQPHVRRTGLIGFCWGANHALNVAWYDGCRGVHPSIHPRVAECLGPFEGDRHFPAGVIAFSPVLRFEELLDKLDTKHSRFRDPALAGLQSTVRDRMTRKGYPDPEGNLRRLIAFELARTPLAGPNVEADAYRFVRTLPYRNQPDDNKLQSARTPTLIVHGANDPLVEAQDVATLFAQISNPAVAAIILPGGGHVGFAPFAKNYYYSLIVNFFSRQTTPP